MLLEHCAQPCLKVQERTCCLQLEEKTLAKPRPPKSHPACTPSSRTPKTSQTLKPTQKIRTFIALDSQSLSKISHCAVTDDTHFHEPDGYECSECDRDHDTTDSTISDTRLGARPNACASPINENTSTDPLQSSVIDLRALLARWKDKHGLKVLIPSTIHPCIHHPSNKVAPRIAGPTKNAIIIPEDKLICTYSRT